MPSSKQNHAESLRRIEISEDIERIKTEQLEVDLSIEQEKLDRKQVRLAIEKVTTQIERERLTQAGYGLDVAKIETDTSAIGVQSAALKMAVATDGLLALEAERTEKQRSLVARHRLLQLTSIELETDLSQRLDQTQTILGLLPDLDSLDLSMPEILGGKP